MNLSMPHQSRIKISIVALLACVSFFDAGAATVAAKPLNNIPGGIAPPLTMLAVATPPSQPSPIFMGEGATIRDQSHKCQTE